MSLRRTTIFALGLLVLQAGILFWFGQPLIAASGQVLLWVGQTLSIGNSQHLSDWYTFSHVIHGILFYWLLGKFWPQLSMRVRLVLALGIEVAWEVIENTPWLIEHYRQQALAQGYVGDSIINSISDSLAMLVGFVAAWRLPVWVVVAGALLLEALSLYFIRDSLLLNIINLIYPFEFIAAWQMAG
jgi:hypothetical protein